MDIVITHVIIMPICPRCGIGLTTEQSLVYHLTKKRTRCDACVCSICNTNCRTNMRLQIHMWKYHEMDEHCLSIVIDDFFKQTTRRTIST